MAVPPTSPLRVFPQAVNVDVQGFMPQGDLFQKTMAAFEQGSKLPLLQEQIKHEKKRIKMENAKLDFAMSEAGLMQQEEERRRAGVLADIDLLTKQAELAKAQAEARGQEFVDRGAVSLGAAANGDVSPLGESSLAASDASTKAPLAEVTVFGEDFGTRTIPSPSAVEAMAPVAPALTEDQPPVYVPKFVKTKPIENLEIIALPGAIGARDVSGYAEQKARERLDAEFPAFRGARKDEPKYEADKRKRMLELEAAFQPVRTSLSIKDDKGIPLSVPVVKIGDEVVDILGAPTIDTEKLSAAQKKRDEKFQENLSDPQYVSNRVTRDSNVERLLNASQYLTEAKDSWNPFDSRVAGILPESVRNLFESDREKSRNEARTVIQQQLRATLGAQFAFKEGEQMLNRSFNILFDDATNLQMLRNAAQNILTVSRESERAENYFDNNQTLAGFRFNSGLIEEHPVLSKFDAAISEVSPQTKPTPPTTTMTDAQKKTLEKLRGRGPLGTRS